MLGNLQFEVLIITILMVYKGAKEQLSVNQNGIKEQSIS